jgi:hypothetical protein
MQVVLAESFESSQLRVIAVSVLGEGRGSRQNSIALCGGSFPQLGCCPPSSRWHGWLNVHCGFSRR